MSEYSHIFIKILSKGGSNHHLSSITRRTKDNKIKPQNNSETNNNSINSSTNNFNNKNSNDNTENNNKMSNNKTIFSERKKY